MNLRRSTEDHQIAGVCGGLAKHLGWDSGKLRIVWVLATILTKATKGLAKVVRNDLIALTEVIHRLKLSCQEYKILCLDDKPWPLDETKHSQTTP
jgi:phage shock protein PspC (stress-responsive transcriptional regulator)